MDGREMVDMVRNKSQELYQLISSQFDKSQNKKTLIGVGSFYRGKEGAILAYEEARRALNLGLSIGEHKILYHIDDLGIIATFPAANKKWQDNFVRRLLMKLLA